MKVFGNIFGFFTVWQSFEPTFANFHTFGENFNCCKWPNTELTICLSSHTDPTGTRTVQRES